MWLIGLVTQQIGRFQKIGLIEGVILYLRHLMMIIVQEPATRDTMVRHKVCPPLGASPTDHRQQVTQNVHPSCTLEQLVPQDSGHTSVSLHEDDGEVTLLHDQLAGHPRVAPSLSTHGVLWFIEEC